MSFIDGLNKWLTAFQAIAVIGGVAVAVYQLDEIRTQTELQSRTLEDQRVAQSATLILRFKNALDSYEYNKITDAIQEHDQKHKLLVTLGILLAPFELGKDACERAGWCLNDAVVNLIRSRFERHCFGHDGVIVKFLRPFIPRQRE